MKLCEIMKPFFGEAPAAALFEQDTEVGSIRPDSLARGGETVYIDDTSGAVVGRIDREVLAYVVRKHEGIKLSFILDHIDEGVIAVDAEGRIFYANRTYTQLLGVPVGKIIGKMIQGVEANAAIIDVLRTRRPIIREKTHIETIGRLVSVRIYPLFVRGVFEGAVSIFKDVTELNSLNREITRITEVAKEYHNQISAQKNIRDLEIIGDAPKFVNLIEQALVVAQTDATVLIRGENGTGKEMFARLIRNHGARADKPFISVNCAAIPENLIESELFGYEEGSFTGARRGGRAGKFQLAEGGTLFLDEIGDMPYAMQAKLLRVLQQGEVERLGGEESIPVDVRIIAATNQPLEELIEKRLFRQDLYYRLNVVSLVVPPLRERSHDILLLVNHFLAEYNRKYGKNLTLDNELYRELERHRWPGNVRELKNFVERAVVLATGPVLGRDAVPPSASDSAAMEEASPACSDDRPPLREALRRYETDFVREALRKCGNRKAQAMAALGLSRRTFYRKLRELGLEQDRD